MSENTISLDTFETIPALRSTNISPKGYDSYDTSLRLKCDSKKYEFSNKDPKDHWGYVGSFVRNFISSPTATSIVSSKVLNNYVEASFVCVVTNIDIKNKTIDARVYDNRENILVMEISSSLNNFDKSDAELIRENAVFYWSVGRRTLETKHSNGKIKITTNNYSEFKLRRIYTSKTLIKNDIEKISQKYADFFGS